MNVFKSRRKAKEQSEALDALSGLQSPPTPHKSMKSLRRKNKNIPEEAKPVFNLASALPDDSQLRTSLLMPNLSARFSMLREQDDPHTKVGKASDDSVLFPKRASRLNLFGHTQLADVAEVESIHSTFRPPFAERERSNSLGDGYESDNGSIMNRSRPGEGNNLFGGRQRLYRLPTNSNRAAGDAEATFSGRHVYESDVAKSQLLQQTRKEKESPVLTEDNRTSVPVTDTGDSSEIASPATAFSKNRGTQSSTNSAPRRSSTAATSVASESPVWRDSAADSVLSKSHDGTVQNQDNHSSLSVSKAREDPIPNRFMSQSKRDKPQRPSPIYATASLRNVSSPPIVPMSAPLDFGFKTEMRSASATGRYQTSSPTPNQESENDNVLASNVQPSDRGKATALGLFNKPAKEFDEHQFNQRQIQMHEGHISYLSNGSRSTSRASNDAARMRQNSIPGVSSPSPVPDNRTSTPQVPPVPSTSASPIPHSNRASKASGRSTPPRPRSKSTASATAVSNMKARVESMIRKQNAELAAFEAEKLGKQELSENKENYAQAFFDNDDEEESDYEESTDINSSRITSSRVDESDIHPAFRNSYRASNAFSRKSNYSNFSRTKSILDDDHKDTSKLQIPTIETEHVGQQGGLGLSGLIKTHLRQNSDKSSILLRPESSIVISATDPSRRESVASTSKTAIDSLRSDPFDLEGGNGSHPSEPRLTPTTAMSLAAQRFLSQAMAIKDAAEAEKEENDGTKSWHESAEPGHKRDASTETTKERREFDEDLAERRRKIREGLKGVAERDRSQSPANFNKVQLGSTQTLGQQRSVTDPPSKTMKMLGRYSASNPVEDDRGRSFLSRNESRSRPSDNASRGINQIAAYARFTETNSEQPQYKSPPPRSATPPAIRHGRRERSNSTVEHRSKSRTRPVEINPPLPNTRGYLADWNLPSPSPTEESFSNPNSVLGQTGSLKHLPSPPNDLFAELPTRSSPKLLPLSPQSPNDSPFDSTGSLSGSFISGRTTPSNGRATPNSAFNRKRSVTKTMISEPTFVSSTSSVPLVHLPTAQVHTAFAPPLPLMNPRRRGNTAGEKPALSPASLAFSRSTPLEPVPASPVVTEFGSQATGKNSPSPRKLRKANSEGGSMAAKAKQQAMTEELAQEKIRSPALPVFPNRSATSLGTTQDGAMF